MNDLLPLIFLGLMAFAMLIYVVLDGYDLGVGILLRRAEDSEKDRMIASIGPFWDANETWLVLGVGILLVAFPVAHGIILGGLLSISGLKPTPITNTSGTRRFTAVRYWLHFRRASCWAFIFWVLNTRSPILFSPFLLD